MAVLKWKSAKGWLVFYASYLKNCLQKSKNLGDLTDRAKARENLELVGDVTTHNHDSRYMSLINGMKSDMSGSLTQQIEDLKNYINGFIYVGPDAPQSPKDNLIWFDTKHKLIKFYNGNKWNAFGSISLDKDNL